MLTLRLAGSEIRTLHLEGGDLWIHFSAAHVERRDASEPPGTTRPASGYLKPVSLHLREVVWLPTEQAAFLGDCFGAVAEGRLALEGICHQALALPLRHRGRIELTLSMQSRDTWRFTASEVRSDVPNDAHFSEAMAC